jgi:hypothetical protein
MKTITLSTFIKKIEKNYNSQKINSLVDSLKKLLSAKGDIELNLIDMCKKLNLDISNF